VEILQRYPRNPLYWITLAKCGFLSGRQTLASQAVDRALDLLPNSMFSLRASLLRSRAAIIAERDAKTALKNLMQAYLLDGDDFLFIQSVRAHGPIYLVVNQEQCLNEISCPAEKRQILLALSGQALDRSLIASLSTLEENLRRMADLCKDYETQAVFLTYPVAQPHIGEVSRRVAEQTGSRWLNMEAHFEPLLKNDSKQAILRRGRFTPYATRLMGEWIAGDLKIQGIH
jgi:hypothetical protein